MADSIRILSLGFSSSELHMMQVVLDAAAKTLPRGFRLVNAQAAADIAVVNWSTLNIERTQAFLAQRFGSLPLISVSETGVLGAPGICVAEAHLLSNLAAMVYEAIDGVDPAFRARPPEYVSWLSIRRRDDTLFPMAHEPVAPNASTPVFAAPPLAQEARVRELEHFRVLLVDARSDQAEAAEQALLRLGMRVEVAIDEQDAWVRQLARVFDAILIDAGMVDESGFKLCRRISHASQRKAPPVFMLADRLRPIDRARGAHAGSAGFLSWAMRAEDLIAVFAPLRRLASVS